MPDLTMCKAEDCVKRQSCRRSPHSGTVANDRFQSWFADDPRKDPVVHRDIYCLHYWPIHTLED
jgi:hypothetical protein